MWFTVQLSGTGTVSSLALPTHPALSLTMPVTNWLIFVIISKSIMTCHCARKLEYPGILKFYITDIVTLQMKSCKADSSKSF